MLPGRLADVVVCDVVVPDKEHRRRGGRLYLRAWVHQAG